jgi:hypothetical protein
LLLVEGPRGLAQLALPWQDLGEATAVPDPGSSPASRSGRSWWATSSRSSWRTTAASRSWPPHRRLADQIPFVLLMVAYTMVGRFLLVIS